MAGWQIGLLVVGIIILVLGVLYFVGRKMQKKMDDQQAIINQNTMTTSILVLNKKKQKITETNLPKMVIDQMPKIYRFRKLPIVKAKVGPQIMTLICDGKIFKDLPTKKKVKVDLAGIYITGMKGATKGNTKQPIQNLSKGQKYKMQNFMNKK